MGVIEKTNSDKNLRIHCVGSIKFMVEDWMLGKDNNGKEVLDHDDKDEQ